ncbi:MAG: aminotransferase class I/II-fold pyridoxal phosphate-dependent enzyme [Coriobacteriales bacterium]|jgi:histidinol-phosphate aminotransferase|nr:aminotransferase class I/II-fold pyridoxal phosphate-dependent enzyme [Coriobacteriales bacterium]
MDKVRSAALRFKDLEPYDPTYLPARISLNANENPYGLPAPARRALQEYLASASLHRYPDPLAKQLRAQLATGRGLSSECVLLGNGGDELLFDLCLAYGGPGHALLVAPPTFSVYGTDALLTGTNLVQIQRLESVISSDKMPAVLSDKMPAVTPGKTSPFPQPAAEADAPVRPLQSTADASVLPKPAARASVCRLRFSLDEQAVLRRVERGDIDLVILTSPNNPTGDCLRLSFVEQLVCASDALVLIDHAYIEFSEPDYNVERLLSQHVNLAVLRTFSKAYALAGMRIGYLLAAPEVIYQLSKVRQPYSVDTFAAQAALAVLDAQAQIDAGVARIVAERNLLEDALGRLGLLVAPSEANYLLFRLPQAHEVWRCLYANYGILLRDLSRVPGLTDCLRVSVGSARENSEFLSALTTILSTLLDTGQKGERA